MAPFYDPDPFQWVALIVLVSTAYASANAFLTYATSFNWQQWWDKKETYKPGVLLPEIYTIFRFLAYLSLAFGVWLILREADFAGFVPPETDPNAGIPSAYNFRLVMIFYLLFWVFSTSVGASVFTIGLGWGWLSVPIILELFTWVCILVMDIYAFYIWWVPGLLILVALVYSTISVLIFILFAVYTGTMTSKTIRHPFAAVSQRLAKLEIAIKERMPKNSNGETREDVIVEIDEQREEEAQSDLQDGYSAAVVETFSSNAYQRPVIASAQFKANLYS